MFLEAGIRIPFGNEVKSLGVILIDSKLSWRPHINSVTKKVNKALYGLKYIKSCPTDVSKRGLVVPHLDYYTVVSLTLLLTCALDFKDCAIPVYDTGLTCGSA